MATGEPEPEPDLYSLAREELKPLEKRTLLELRLKLEDAINSNRLLKPPHRSLARTRVGSSFTGDPFCTTNHVTKEELLGISVWGVPLLPSKRHDATDTILLKFLRAKDFKVFDSLEMLKKTLRWRRELGVDGILDEDLGSPELEGSAFVDSADKDGRPVCYSVYGAFRDRELYDETFRGEELLERFVRWRVKAMEKGVKRLSFKPGGVTSMVQITDLEGLLRARMKKLHAVTKKAVTVIQDNYPELVAKDIFINVSLRHYAYHRLFSHFLSKRSKNKFVLVRPSKVTETLLKYIPPEKLPVQYGGLKREPDEEFTAEDGVSELIVKGGSAKTIEIPVVETGVTVVWDITVVGWEVKYKEEFIPEDECSYKVLIQKEMKLEQCIRNSFYISEPGRVVLTVANRTFKKKRILHRSKSKPTIPLYNLLKKMSHDLV